MPPTTQEFKKLISLRRLLGSMADGEDVASVRDEFLALLPELEKVFSPAFPPAVREHLKAIETELRSGRSRALPMAQRAAAIIDGLGLRFPDGIR